MAAPPAGMSSSIPLSIFPPDIAAQLAVFDADGSGSIDPSELAAAAKRAHEDQKTLTRFRWLAVIGVVLFVILSAMQFGVSLAAVSLAKESHVSGATMTTLNGDVVRTANSDFVVGADGVATARNASGPIAVAVHSQSFSSLSSYIPDEVFLEMAQITLTSATGATMTIKVQGFVRTADRSVELLTPVGTIIINGTVVSFANTASLSTAFEENGFLTTTPGGGRAAAARAGGAPPPGHDDYALRRDVYVQQRGVVRVHLVQRRLLFHPRHLQPARGHQHDTVVRGCG